MYSDTPMLCQGRVLCVGIDHTNEHTNCKNLKVFSCISIEVWFKSSRDSMRDQEVQLCSISNKEAPVPCQQAPGNHDQHAKSEFCHAPTHAATTYDRSK